jgi:ABC-type dipeptide/oligopeptide/nickel transport system permease subunit
VIAVLKQLEFVELTQLLKQLDVEIMLKHLVNKDVLELLLLQLHQ